MPRRSPIIFWLLLAATLCVDGVTIVWVLLRRLAEDSATLFLALSFANLGVLCVWVVFVPKRIRFSWLAPLLTGVAIAATVLFSANGPSGDDRSKAFLGFIALTWFHVAIVLPVLWLLKPTRIGAAFSESGTKPRWQFSVTHLIAAMTSVAILSVLVRQSEWIDRSIVIFATLPIANVALLLLPVIVVHTKLHWFLRMAMALGSALAIAAVCKWIGAKFTSGLNFYAYALIQSGFIWAWLETFRSRAQVKVSGDANQLPPSAS